MQLAMDDETVTSELIHGVLVQDPFRWLEQRDAPETERWLESQRQILEAYFHEHPVPEWLREHVTAYLTLPKTDQITRVGSRLFYRRSSRTEEQPAIYDFDLQTGIERQLVPPSPENPFLSAKIYSVSPDGSLLAYESRDGGEHTKEIRFVDVEANRLIDDFIPRSLIRGVCFLSDGKGFYYCHEEPVELSSGQHTIKLHRFGTSMATDEVVFSSRRSEKSKLVVGSTGSGMLAIHAEVFGKSVKNSYFLTQLSDAVSWAPIFTELPENCKPFVHMGRFFGLKASDETTNCLMELTHEGTELRVIIPSWQTDILQISLTSSHFVVSHLVDLRPILRIFTLDGSYVRSIEFCGEVSIYLTPGYGSNDAVFYRKESFDQPPQILRLDPGTGETNPLHYDLTLPAPLKTPVKRHTYLSTDGTPVNLFLVQPDSAIHGPRPVILTAYGGFGIPMVPQFSIFVSVLLELGFRFALANIRGGSERGRSWHEAARGTNRQRAFDDFIAAAEWLIEEEYASEKQLAIFGGSNSGLLVGAAMTQRPELFRAVLCIAPLLDMVRYHLFDRAYVWSTEYGTSEDATEFESLHAYSPYHQIQDDVNYPAVLFVTGDKDSRCNPAHVRKTAARLQSGSLQTRPILVDHTSMRGHAATLPLSTRVEALVRRITFICNELGVAIPERSPHDCSTH